MDQLTAIWAPRVLAILRIVTALIFIEHGAQKLFGFPAPPQGGQPPLLSLLGFAAVMEFFGGLLVLVGFLTRPVGVPARGRDGGRLLDGPCAAELLSGAQRRRCRDPVLFRLPLLGVRRPRRLEHRRERRPQPIP